MSHQAAFIAVIFIILVVLVAYVFACERAHRQSPPGRVGGAERSAARREAGALDITQFVVPAESAAP